MWSALAAAQRLGRRHSRRVRRLGLHRARLTFVLEQKALRGSGPAMPTLVLGALAIVRIRHAGAERPMAFPRSRRVMPCSPAPTPSAVPHTCCVRRSPQCRWPAADSVGHQDRRARRACRGRCACTGDDCRGLTVFIVDPRPPASNHSPRHETTARDVQCSLELSQVFVSDDDCSVQ